MRNFIALVLLVIVSSSMPAQEAEKESRVINVNQIKIGFASQIDVDVNKQYDVYYDGYNYGYYNDKGGMNLQPFIAYEHIWEFSSHVAIALEPRIGFSIKEKIVNGFAGLDTKFYWANNDFWRMGIAFYGGYGYANENITIAVPMEGGQYFQKKDLKMHFHRYSFEFGIIPFQFKLKNIPVTIESQFAIFGFSRVYGKSDKYNDGNVPDNHYSGNSFIPYFLKGELKIGYVFPSK